VFQSIKSFSRVINKALTIRSSSLRPSASTGRAASGAPLTSNVRPLCLNTQLSAMQFKNLGLQSPKSICIPRFLVAPTASLKAKTTRTSVWSGMEKKVMGSCSRKNLPAFGKALAHTFPTHPVTIPSLLSYLLSQRGCFMATFRSNPALKRDRPPAASGPLAPRYAP